MKSKRRHELQQNVLDSELGKILGFFKRNANRLLWGAVVLAAVLLLVTFLYKQSRQRRLMPLEQYELAKVELDPNQQLQALRELSDQKDNKQVAALATVDLGDAYLTRAVLAGPEQGQADLDQAEGLYQRIVREYADMPLLLARAHVGLARVAENRRDFTAAKQQYEAVLAIAGLEGQPVVELARSAVEQLDEIDSPVPMATTAPATQTQPATAPADTQPVE